MRAWELAEQARSRALLDMLRRRPPTASKTPVGRMLRHADELQRQIDGLLDDLPHAEGKERFAGGSGRAAAVAVRERWLADCLDRLEAVDPAAARLRRLWTPSLEEVSAALGTDTTLVEYYVGEDALTAFVLARGHLDVVRIPVGAAELEALVRRMRFHVERPDAMREALGTEAQPHLLEAALASLRDLDAAILRPLRRHLTTRRLVIVPHGVLHGVPFQALGDGERTLLDAHEVVRVPSAYVWLHCRRERAAGKGDDSPLVMGVPDERAPLIADEVDRVALIHGGRGRPHVGPAATRTLLARRGRRARLIHLACHASYRPDEPMLAGLRLGDGWLTLPQIYDLELQADVLVLSGCATGCSRVSGGDDLFGLARGFLQAGVRNLVASMWNVSDASAACFMEAFHQTLADGSTPAHAMRAAARTVRARFPHPHDWAPFVLTGTGDAAPRSPE